MTKYLRQYIYLNSLWIERDKRLMLNRTEQEQEERQTFSVT